MQLHAKSTLLHLQADLRCKPDIEEIFKEHRCILYLPYCCLDVCSALPSDALGTCAIQVQI